MSRAFERLAQEGAKPFAAFTAYLKLGANRSLAAVGQELGKSTPLLERWARRYDWAARARAYDTHLAVVEREAAEAKARAKSEEWLRRQQELRDAEWAIHEACLRVSKEAMKRFLENARRGATLGDIARLIEVGSKLGRLASGMATDRTEITGQDGGPVQLELTAALNKIYGELVEVAGPPGRSAPEDRQIALLPPIDVLATPTKAGQGGSP